MRSLALAAAVTAVLLATGCASQDPSTPASASSAATSPAPSGPASTTGPPTGSPSGSGSPSAPAAAPGVKVIDVTISGAKISPTPGRVRVRKGEQVKITVTGDKPDEIHVHGYDLEAPVKPGAPAVVEFTASRTGQFEVETHETEKVLLFLLVQ